LQLASFSFFVIGWIHQSLHSFNCGAFQVLIRITVQMVEDDQGECIERCPAQFLDQLRLAGSRCTRDHNHVASPTALVAPPSFRRLSPHPRQSCMSEVLHTCAYVFERYNRVFSPSSFGACFELLRSGTKAPVPVQLDEILVPLG